MASKQNIKETINLLCKVIDHHGSTKLTPETLRVAKFDKDEATKPMWMLLFETNRFLNYGSFECVEAITEERKRDVVLCTKHEMFSRGYFAKDFFILPDDMTSGSREVLLAFGWSLARGKFFRILLENCSNLLEECLPLNEESLSCRKPIASENVAQNSEKSSENLQFCDDVSDLEQLPWILGNLKFTCNGLYTAEQCLISLVSKVHHDTLGADNPKGHLSTLEVFLLRHPNELVKFQEKLERYNSYLGNLLKLVEQQDIFWKWMESVYEANLAESKGAKDVQCSPSENCKTCHENKTKEFHRVSKTKLSLQKVLDEGNLSYLLAREMLKNDGAEPCRDLDGNWLELNGPVKSLCLEESVSIPRKMPQTFSELQKLPPSGSTTGDEKPLAPSCAQTGIEVLRRKICQLEVEVMQMKKVHFETLNNLTSNLDELVCIPPIQASKYTELKINK